MKPNARSLILGLFALMLLSVVYATTVFAADEVAITGEVFVNAWDDNHNVTAASILTSGAEYIIVDNAVGKELFKLDLKVVKASGVVGEDSEGNKTIAVTKYEVMPE